MGNRILHSVTDCSTVSWVLYRKIIVNGKRSLEMMNRVYICTIIIREQRERYEGCNDGWIKV